MRQKCSVNTDTSLLSEPSSQQVLTLQESAAILRCSKAHISNLLNGKVPNTPRLPHFRLGRRVLTRLEWVLQWMEENKER